MHLEIRNISLRSMGTYEYKPKNSFQLTLHIFYYDFGNIPFREKMCQVHYVYWLSFLLCGFGR